MKKEQWTVIGLLALLAGLEIARNAGISGFLNTWWTGFQTALNNASNIIPSGLPGIPGIPGMGTPPAKKPGGNPVKPGQKLVTLPSGTGSGITGGGVTNRIPPLPDWSNFSASQGKPF